MTFDELKTAWRNEMSRQPEAGSIRLDALRADVEEVDRVVRLRDVWIVGLMVLGAGLQVLFGWLTQPVVDPLAKAGTLLFAVAAAITCVVLLRARRVESADDWTLRARLRREIEKLERQHRIADRVAVWFLLPSAPPMLLLTLGGQHLRTGSYVPSAQLWAYYAVWAALFLTTCWLQRREARRKFEPLLARVRQLYAELEESA
jgi:hypothetical protein